MKITIKLDSGKNLELTEEEYLDLKRDKLEHVCVPRQPNYPVYPGYYPWWEQLGWPKPYITYGTDDSTLTTPDYVHDNTTTAVTV